MSDGTAKIRPPLPEVIVDIDRWDAGGRGAALEAGEWRGHRFRLRDERLRAVERRSLMTSISKSTVPGTGIATRSLAGVGASLPDVSCRSRHRTRSLFVVFRCWPRLGHAAMLFGQDRRA